MVDATFARTGAGGDVVTDLAIGILCVHYTVILGEP